MYQQKTHRSNKTSRPSLSFLHGKVKNEINRIFFIEKCYGWAFPKTEFKLSDLIETLGLKAYLHHEDNGQSKLAVSKLLNSDNKNGLGLIITTSTGVDPVWDTHVETQLFQELDKHNPGDTFSLSIRTSMKKVRKDAPDRVAKIYQLKRIDQDTFSIISEYDFTRATQQVTKTRANDIAQQLLQNEKHELHAFISNIKSNRPISFASIIEETLEHWDKVY